MLQTTKARLAARRDADRGEGGFTLIELMVVVLIIAILLAIAIPTFLGAQNKAKDRSAQSSLRNALTAAKTIYADTQSYATADSAGLPAVEPSLTYKATAALSTGPKDVSVDAAAGAWYGAALSKTNTCFYIKDTPSGSQFAKGTAANCTGTFAAAATGGPTYTAEGW